MIGIMCLCISVGKIVGVYTPIQKGTVSLTSALLGKDMKAGLRTVQSLLGKAEIRESILK